MGARLPLILWSQDLPSRLPAAILSIYERVWESNEMGFLREIERHFRDEPQGRYLSHILKECAIFDPDIVDVLFPNLSQKTRDAVKLGQFQIRDTWWFRGHHKAKRYPDLTLVVGSRTEGICEIKAEDANAPGNVKQLDDYYRYLKAHPYCHFSRVSKHGATPLFPKRLAAMGRASDLRFAQIHSALSSRLSAPKPLRRMLVEYLEDHDMVGYRDLEDDEVRALKLLVIRALPLPYNHGLGNTLAWKNVMLVPDVMKKLLGNTAALGEILEQNSEAWRFDSNYFNVWPWLKAERVHKSMKKELAKNKQDRDDSPALDEKDVSGGYVSFSFRLSTKASKTKRRYLEGGYLFVVELSEAKAKRLRGYMYFSTWNNPPYREAEGVSKAFSFNKLPDQKRATKLLLEAWNDLGPEMKAENCALPKNTNLRDALLA